GKVVVYSRHKRELRGTRGKFDYLASEVLLPKPWIIDGELCKSGMGYLGIYYWDVGMVGGKFVGNTPYLERMNSMEDMVPRVLGNGSGFETFFCRTIWAECDSKYYKAVKTIVEQAGHLEGLVYKLKGATDLWGISST